MILPPPCIHTNPMVVVQLNGNKDNCFFPSYFSQLLQLQRGPDDDNKKVLPSKLPHTPHHTFLYHHPPTAHANVFEKSRQIQIIFKYIHLFTFRYDLSILSKSKVYANYPKIAVAGNSKKSQCGQLKLLVSSFWRTLSHTIT